MSLDAIKSLLPEYARDQRLNLSTVLDNPALTPRLAWSTAVACAAAARNPSLTKAIVAASREHLSDEERAASLAAASIMGMNNIYYRFTHLVADPEYRSMPARLRMNVIGKPGIDKVEFELLCLAVSTINGCAACVDSHEKVVREGGMSKEVVQASVRIAAVMHAIAVTLDAESALA